MRFTNLVNHACLDVVPVTAVKSDNGGCVEARLNYDIHNTFSCQICCLKIKNNFIIPFQTQKSREEIAF